MVLAILAGMVLSNLVIGLIGAYYNKKKRDEINDCYMKLDVLSKDGSSLETAKDIRAYHLEYWLMKAYDLMTMSLFKMERKVSVRFFLGSISDSVFLCLRDLVSYALLIPMVLNGSIDLATFTLMVGVIAGFSTWSNGFLEAMFAARKDTLLVTDYRNALDMEDVFVHEGGIDAKTLKTPLEIEFEHVSFHYPGAEEDVLKNISFTVRPGEKIALVGANGAGKTTLVKILSGLYKPTSGRILIDGIDMNEINIDQYMTLVSAVFQDVVPLSLTIAQNIAFTDVEMNDKGKIWDTLDRAGLKEKVMSLPKGLDTYITEVFDKDGIRLSGGETQKLMLARALYKNAPLLLLDEPTAALDPLAEEAMYMKYLNFTKDNTSFFISHRLASTRFSDRIFLLEGGSISAVGNHEELMKTSSSYHEMFETQAKYYREGGQEDEEVI